MLAELRLLRETLSLSQRREVWLLLALSLFAGLSELATIGMLVPFLDAIVSAQTAPRSFAAAIGQWLGLEDAGDTAIVLAASVVGFAILSAILRLILIWRTEKFCARFAGGLVRSIYGRVMRETFASFDARNTSEVLAAVDKVQAVEHGFVRPLLTAVTSALIAICLTGFLVAFAPVLTLIMCIAVGLIYGAISVFSIPRIRSYSRQMSEGWGKRTRFLRESLGAKREIMLARRFKHFEALLAEADDLFRTAQARNQTFAQSPKALFQSGMIVAIALLALGMMWVGNDVAGALPLLAAMLLAVQRILPLAQAVWNGSVQASGNREIVRDVTSLVSHCETEVPHEDIAPLGLRSQLRCDDVSFAYPDGAKVLDAVDLTLSRGEWVGICGPSGSGKSTLVDLLFGFQTPTSGTLSVDGELLENQRLIAWQNATGFLRERSFLLDASIIKNICFGEDPADRSMARLQKVLDIAGLEEFVASLPQGLDAPLAEDGIKVSAGQRQRIALARALYRMPDVLVLDEATNALDLTLEAEIFARLSAERPDLTVFLVTHRTQSLVHCGRRFEVREGKVVQIEDGARGAIRRAQ